MSRNVKRISSLVNLFRRGEHRARRWLPTLLLSLILIVSLASAAAAHFAYQRAVVWEDDAGRCLDLYSEISHGNGGGYTKTVAETYQQLEYWRSCFWPWQRGPGYIRAKNQMWAWFGSYWGICRGTAAAWKYNSTTTNDFRIEGYRGLYGDTTKPPCGPRWYVTRSLSQVQLNGVWYPRPGCNAERCWQTGVMWSCIHYLPPPSMDYECG
jgi:hypothetical protein